MLVEAKPRQKVGGGASCCLILLEAKNASLVLQRVFEKRQQGLAFLIYRTWCCWYEDVCVDLFLFLSPKTRLKLFADGSRLSCVLGVGECVWPRGDSQSHASS